MCAASFHAAALCPESVSFVIAMPVCALQDVRGATFSHAAAVLAKSRAEFAAFPAAAAEQALIMLGNKCRIQRSE